MVHSVELIYLTPSPFYSYVPVATVALYKGLLSSQVLICNSAREASQHMCT